MSETTARSGVSWGPIIAAMALALTFFTTGGVALWGLARSAAQGEQTAMALNGLRNDVRDGLNELRQQNKDIPTLTASVSALERQQRESEARDAAQDQRVDSLRQRVIEIAADVEGLKRASAVPLPGARR